VAQQLQARDNPVHWLEEHPLNGTIFAPFFAALDPALPAAITTLLAYGYDVATIQ